MYDALTTHLHVLLPDRTARRACACRASAGSSSCPARSIRPSTGSSSRAAAAPSIPGSSRTTTSTGRRSASQDDDQVRQPDDVEARGRRRRARATSQRARIKAGEWPWSFFCWPEERPRPVFPSAFTLLAPSELGRSRRRRGALPGLRQGLGEPRHARARRRAVPQRPRGRSRRASLRARRRCDRGGVPRRALVGVVRRPPSRT